MDRLRWCLREEPGLTLIPGLLRAEQDKLQAEDAPALTPAQSPTPMAA